MESVGRGKAVAADQAEVIEHRRAVRARASARSERVSPAGRSGGRSPTRVADRLPEGSGGRV